MNCFLKLTKYLFQGAGYLKRADTEKLHEIFLKYATVEKNGQKYITSEDFVRKFLGLFDEGKVLRLFISYKVRLFYYLIIYLYKYTITLFYLL